MKKLPKNIKIWYVFDDDIPGRWYAHFEDTDTGEKFAWGQSGGGSSLELYLYDEDDPFHYFAVYEGFPSYSLTTLIEREYLDYIENQEQLAQNPLGETS